MIDESFDDELLGAYAERFFGYGSYSGKYWFVGMEEGGGDLFSEVQSRLQTWHQHGRCELEDLYGFHHDVGIRQWFRPQAKIQPTWSKYIRIMLNADGEEATTEHVRGYQADSLGRIDGESCLLELLPLPSPSLGHWHYARRSRLPQLADRETYMAYCASRRAGRIGFRIREYKPRVVVFSSVDVRYRTWWEEMAGVSFTSQRVAGRTSYVGKSKATFFVIIQHPVARGITNEYFRQVGSLVRPESSFGPP